MKQTGKAVGIARALSATAIAAIFFLAGAAGGQADTTGVGESDPAARFRGPLAYDFGVTNVRWEAATKEYSYVIFDLHWSYSWRAKWTEPADKNVTGKPLEVENWDAAWVFVKFMADKDSAEARERNYWPHATLDADPAHHVMPAGATNSVKLSDDGARAMGVFIYRAAVGHGRNDWKGVKLRWMHAVDGVDPARAGVRAYALPMVYVPRGQFKVGSGSKSAFKKFGDGPTFPMTRCDPNPDDEGGSLCDGSWRGGPVIPFLVDEEWSGPAAEGSRARRIGRAAGELWSTLTYPEVGGGLSSLGAPGVLGDGYPTGYEPFYCMKYNLTQGQYVEYLNSLPPDVAAGRAYLSDEFGVDYPIGSSAYEIEVSSEYKPLVIREKGGLTITLSRESLTNGCGAPLPGRGLERKAPDVLTVMDEPAEDPFDGLDGLIEALDEPSPEEKTRQQRKVPPVYTARLPFRTCCGFSLDDVRAYAVWAGLRPLSELEFEKASRGPLNPVPYEATWGSTHAVYADTGEDLVDAGLPTERCRKGNYGGGYGAFLCVIRAGCFATPTSDRVSAAATYWGILEMGGDAVPLIHRQFQGTHGDGSSPAGSPGGSAARHLAPFRGPEDWPEVMGGRGMTDRAWINKVYIGGRFGSRTCRLVTSAPGVPRVLAKPATTPAAKAPAPIPAAAPSPDGITVSNVKWAAAGRESGMITFDLAWKNSWRAKWTEPAEKNVTGKPLALENWDAAWVFAKFPGNGEGGAGGGEPAWRHALLDPDAANHPVPAGAALDVGLTDDGSRGVGVFVYRATPGDGPVEFKGIKLHLADPPSASTPPSPAGVSVQAIGMVYVPAGAFRSKTPWKDTFATIRNPDATAPAGCRVATNAPVEATWPNGVNAFYCMKHGINQGLYAAYLNFGALNPGKEHASYRPSAAYYGFGRQTVRFDEARDMFVAEQPDLPRSYISWPEILAVTAWAGLRPITDLEYEKACRGPRAVARAEDAWADGICAPAAGLAPGTVTPLPGLDRGASYWGIRGLSLTGCRQEWPGTVSDGEYGFRFTGMHSAGGPKIPADWPEVCAFGQHYGYKEFIHVGVWLLPADLDNLPHWEPFSFDRTGRYGARAVRTAPFRPDDSSPLQFDAVPNLFGCDVGIFELAGRFRNDGDQAVKVELATDLPDACFPDGPASRAFTAAPKAVTPFRVLTTLTGLSAAEAARSDRTLPVRIRAAGGDVLAQQVVRLAITRPAEIEPPAISSIDGGEVSLRIANRTGKSLAVAVEMNPPPGVKLAGTARRVEIAAGAESRASFGIPPQFFAADAVQQIPYVVAVAGGSPQGGETPVDLRTQSRWWVSRRIKAAPRAAGGDGGLLGTDDLGGAMGEIMFDDIAEDTGAVFKSDDVPKGWQALVSGPMLPLNTLGAVPSLGSTVRAATRVMSPVEQDAVLAVEHRLGAMGVDRPPPRFFLRIKINDEVVYDAQSGGDNGKREGGKDVRLRQGANTLLVNCRSMEGVPVDPGSLTLRFRGPEGDEELSGLLFDMGMGGRPE